MILTWSAILCSTNEDELRGSFSEIIDCWLMKKLPTAVSLVVRGPSPADEAISLKDLRGQSYSKIIFSTRIIF